MACARSAIARIAEVRGAGLFIGVDLVDADGHPDEAFTLDVVNGLRDRRVLLSATAATTRPSRSGRRWCSTRPTPTAC